MGFWEFITANLWAFWLVVAAMFLVIELSTTALVSVWFVAGACVAAGASVFIDSIPLQIIIFMAFSAIFLLLFRKLYKQKMIKKTDISDIGTSTVGRVGSVTETVTKFGGKVLVGDVYWHAVSASEDIAVGEKVVVTKLDGTLLTVEKV